MIELHINHLVGSDQYAAEKEAHEKKIAELEEVRSEKIATLNLLTSQNQIVEVCLSV